MKLEDRAGQTYTVPDHWTAGRKLQLLDIHLQNWAQPHLVPAFTRQSGALSLVQITPDTLLSLVELKQDFACIELNIYGKRELT